MSDHRSMGARAFLLALAVAGVATGCAAPGSAIPVHRAAQVAARPTASTVVPTSSPATTTMQDFVRPFAYEIPRGADLRPESSPVSALAAWVGGVDNGWSPSSQSTDELSMMPRTRDYRGVIVGSGEEAWSHSSSGRFMLRSDPAGFLADLRDISGVDITEISRTTLDGRPALVATLPGKGGSDIHVTGRMRGLAGDYVLVTEPSRLIVADIDGTTVFVLIWARSADDLASWLPTADAFVDSFHFVTE